MPSATPPHKERTCSDLGWILEVTLLARHADCPPELAAEVIESVNRLGVPLRQFRGSSVRRDLVRERRRVAVAGRDRGYKWWEIGRALNRDHSSVMSAYRKGQEDITLGGVSDCGQ